MRIIAVAALALAVLAMPAPAQDLRGEINVGPFGSDSARGAEFAYAFDYGKALHFDAGGALKQSAPDRPIRLNGRIGARVSIRGFDFTLALG
jgi:hypothetical protein